MMDHVTRFCLIGAVLFNTLHIRRLERRLRTERESTGPDKLTAA